MPERRGSSDLLRTVEPSPVDRLSCRQAGRRSVTTEDMYGRGNSGDPDDSNDLIGEVIDKRYRITGVLGRGGMGTVFRAEHVTIRREVALKLLHPTFSKIREIGRRFEREAFAAGRVDHPNCVTASDFGELEDGTLFLVMELLEGDSLATLIERHGRIAPRRALHITRHVLRGLAAAHSAGVVHRDIKPDNIILGERDGDPDFARILDFGIAKLVGEAEAEAGGEKLTQAGVAFGTPHYLSPEQALGKPVDPRADLYSVSAVLHEMLTGAPPFDAEDKLQVLAMHATAPVPRLSDTAPNLSVPTAVEELVRRGLGKTPGDRFDSAEEYLAAIERALPECTATPESSPPPRTAALTPAPLPGTALTPAPVPTANLTPAPLSGTAPTPVPLRGGARRTAPIREAIQGYFSRLSRGGRIAFAVTSVLFVLLVISAIVGRSYENRTASQRRRDQLLEKYTRVLERGKRCKQRAKAVPKLRALGDKRAIPILEKALRRKSKGIAGTGLGAEEINACFRQEAKEAIQHLEEL